jgi:hypothetical protein
MFTIVGAVGASNFFRGGLAGFVLFLLGFGRRRLLIFL